MRVVSLVPSVTETLLSWGVTPIAVTRFCEQPSLPTIGGTKDPDVAAIVALEPDLVVVCDEENRREDADALAGHGVPLYVISTDSVDDVGPSLEELRQVMGLAPHPLRLPAAEEVRAFAAAPVRAFVPIWRRPWMTMSGRCYGSSLLAHLGVENVFGQALDRYPVVELDEVAAREPEVVLAPSEPYPFSARHLEELERIAPVMFVDGKDLFWWGARTPDALVRLAAELAAELPGLISASSRTG
ncbi:MAG: helical backbone metal receptor [Acidimicrobiales bacterium]|nr:helical backbone metal receptor [Acidimicrobiales bacterium]